MSPEFVYISPSISHLGISAATCHKYNKSKVNKIKKLVKLARTNKAADISKNRTLGLKKTENECPDRAKCIRTP